MSSPDLTLWRERSQRFLLGGSATVALTLSGAIRTKWLASALSAAGLGALAQVFSMQAWLGTACGLGLSAPLASALAAAEAAGNEALARRTLHTAFALVAAVTAVAVTLGLWFAAPISHALLATAAHAPLVRVAMIAVAGLAMQGLVLATFAGRSDLKAPFALAVSGGLASVTATLLLVPRYGLLGGAIGSAMMFPFGVAGAWLVHRHRYRLLLRPWAGVDLTLARKLVSIGAAMLLIAVLDQGVLLALRADYLRRNDVASNGLFQAGLALAQQLGALFYAYLSSYAFGRISAANGAGAVRSNTRRTWTPVVLLAAGMFAVAMVASGPLLRLFFSHRFEAARPLLAWTMVGEFAKVQMQTWILGALPLRGPRRVVAISIVYPIALAAAYAVFVATGAGPIGLAWAYAAAGVTTLIASGIGMSAVGVTLSPRQIGIGAATLAGLAALAAWLR
jgi:O-antigen/teichoic acid export membrane protein